MANWYYVLNMVDIKQHLYHSIYKIMHVFIGHRWPEFILLIMKYKVGMFLLLRDKFVLITEIKENFYRCFNINQEKFAHLYLKSPNWKII